MTFQQKRKRERRQFEAKLEKFLRPTLLALSSPSLPMSGTQIARHLRDRGFPGAWDSEKNNFSVEFGSAFMTLLAAGLLREVSPGRFIRSEGADPLMQSPSDLSASTLRELPEYKRHETAAAKERTRRAFLDLRFDFYCAGRTALLADHFVPGEVLLSYAVEYHLKAALSEIQEALAIDEASALTGRHDLSELWKIASRAGILGGARISSDFFRFATDHFILRYPKGQRSVGDRVGYIRHGGAIVHTFDDAILQLDEELSKFYGNPAVSMGAKALEARSPSVVASFFDKNAMAMQRLDQFASAARAARGSNRIAFSHLEERLETIESSWQTQPSSIRSIRSAHALRLAEWFVYPVFGAPDPDPISLLQDDRKGKTASRRIRENLRQLSVEFGDENVDLLQGSPPGDAPTFLIFDRGAKKWWYETRFGAGGATGEEIDGVIEVARKQFRVRRKK